ncbi:MAG: O-methyltransferase [Candidatus Thorarchaeota archaeon]|jgi:predicted O-methyltransferase YrrM
MGIDRKKASEYIERIYLDHDDPKRLDYICRVSRNDFGSPITDDAARLFKTLIHLVKPKEILEIGTSIGFSTTSMALAARGYGGRITTLEIDSSWAEIAKQIFKREGVSDTIDVVVGDASDKIKNFDDESFDIVFQDSAKPLYPVMLKDCIRVLRKGGLFLVDNTLFPVRVPEEEWSDSLSKIHDFNNMLLKMPVQSTILPIGTGCTVAVKL